MCLIASQQACLWIVPEFVLRANFLMLPLFRTVHSPARSLTTHIHFLTNERMKWFQSDQSEACYVYSKYVLKFNIAYKQFPFLMLQHFVLS